MLEPRTKTIRIQTIDEKVIDAFKFDASPTGDCRVIAAISSDGELFIEIYKADEDIYQVTRIIFDHETAQKIRILFRREPQ